MRLYWGCYWRAVLFVVAQLVVMLPLSFATYLGTDRWIRETGMSQTVSFVVVESISVILGFCLVALYVRLIVDRRIGCVRLVLVTDALHPKMQGRESTVNSGAA